jgi:MoxR-like ATPase
VVKALNVVSKKDAMNDEMSSYNHYKPEEICTCGRWIFFEHMPFYDEKQLVEIVYRKTTKKSTEGQPEKIKEKMSSVRVPAFQKESVKHFFDWLKETKASGASVLQALREAKYAMESKAEKYAESPTLQSMAEDMKKQIALLEELEDKLPRL